MRRFSCICIAVVTVVGCSSPGTSQTNDTFDAAHGDGDGDSEPLPDVLSDTGDRQEQPPPEPPPPGCGNGVLDPGELCDDGNDDPTDLCTSECRPPSCHDGFQSGDETDYDCGGGHCPGCDVGLACSASSDCLSNYCDGSSCNYAASCKALLAADEALVDDVYFIDPDGIGGAAPFEVFCDMTTDGGGWTLVMTSSDDGINTWTWATRELLAANTAPVGSLAHPERDFKSPAYNLVPFHGLLFKHKPSQLWAAYGAVSGGTVDLGSFSAAQPAPMCDLAAADHGYALTAGNLIQGGNLCDTDLYFHLGDHDNVHDCGDNIINGTFGPTWNMRNNGACPFDDPAVAGLGPGAPCPLGQCDKLGDIEYHLVEHNALGFGLLLGLNTGAPGQAENYLQIFVR